MSKFDDGGWAFPLQYNGMRQDQYGMTLRAYAAIKLKVPESGLDWLDRMIEQSRWDDYAARAPVSPIGTEYGDAIVSITQTPESAAQEAANQADAMLAERRKRFADNSTKEQDQ